MTVLRLSFANFLYHIGKILQVLLASLFFFLKLRFLGTLLLRITRTNCLFRTTPGSHYPQHRLSDFWPGDKTTERLGLSQKSARNYFGGNNLIPFLEFATKSIPLFGTKIVDPFSPSSYILDQRSLSSTFTIQHQLSFTLYHFSSFALRRIHFNSKH